MVLFPVSPLIEGGKLADEENQQHGEYGDEGHGTVGHGQQKPHFEIGVVAQQGSELHQHRDGQHSRENGGKAYGQHVGAEEVAVVHMGQQEGNTHCEEQQNGVAHGVVEVPAILPCQQKQGEHINKGNDDPALGPKFCIGVIGEEGKHGGRIVVEAVTDGAGLVEIQGQSVPEGAAHEYCGQYDDHIGSGEDEEVPELELFHEP